MRRQGGVSKRKSFLYDLAAAIVIIALLFYGVIILKGEHYYLISLSIIMTGLLAGVFTFERDRVNTVYISCLAVFIVTAVLSRLVFAPVPQVKPIAAVVILSGVLMGKQAGFMCGVMSMFLSNFYFMQGAWTPFQMFGLGLTGFFAGLIFYEKRRKKYSLNNSFFYRTALAVYGFFSVLIIYGGIVDINSVFYLMGEEVSVYGVVAVYAAGLPLNIIFSVTTAVLLVLTGPYISRIWSRYENKYEIKKN